jgi:cytochrome c-type biogenesis protein CcmE
MRMGKKMRIISILMSITVIAATLGFATFALTQNNSALDYDGTLIISGNADVDVKIEFVECTGGQRLYNFQ